MKLSTYLNLLPRLRMRGAMPPLPNTPSWCGAHFKNNLERAKVTGGWKNSVMRFTTVHSTKYCQGDQIKENEMDGASSTHGRDKKCILVGKPEGKINL
jgi:hypothetical protein